MAEDLREIIDRAKRDCPDIPDTAWLQLEQSIMRNFGGQQVYIAHKNKKKGRLLVEIEAAIDEDVESLSRRLGVGRRRILQLKQLLR